jgi:hypothetical protein
MDSVAKVLEERGWVQGRATNQEGNVCLGAAATMVTGCTGDCYTKFASFVWEKTGKSVVAFNDDYNTTYEDVMILAKQFDEWIQDDGTRNTTNEVLG